MADPRLNSMHLEDPRRQAFRMAREGLLEARGERTQFAEDQEQSDRASGSHTMIQKLGNRLPPDLDYAVVDKELVYPLKVGVNTIGRMPDNDVVVEDPYVSRRHCAILIHASDGCELHDVASKNGTYLNGRKLTEPASLVSGDEIRMCDRQLIFVCKADLSSDKTGAE